VVNVRIANNGTVINPPKFVIFNAVCTDMFLISDLIDYVNTNTQAFTD